MNSYGDFKTKILNIDSSLKAAVKQPLNQKTLDVLSKFIQSFNFLVLFVKDDKNLDIINRQVNKKQEEDLKPLDVLCNNVISKLDYIDSLLKDDYFDFLSLNSCSVEIDTVIPFQSIQYINNLITRFNNSELRDLFSVFDVLKHLDGHNKTLIVLGPNGSGKTSFVNYIKRLDTQVKVIPASKPIMAHGYIPGFYNTTIENFNNEIYSGNSLQEDLLQKLIVSICSEHDCKARKYYKQRTCGDDGIEKSVYEKIKSIFEDYFDVELDDSNFSNKEIKIKKGDMPMFDFNSMSDGERVAFFYIATVMVAPIKSFIVVDEPENHLNPAIYNKIWDRLIFERSDCQFIFISHTMEFINARTNFELMKIKSFTRPNKFDFEFLGDGLENIKSDFVVEIVGSRKPILFCEGDKNDFDYKVYEILFGDKYTVIPTGNCISVENSVEACNKHTNLYSIQSAVGIIDSDLKSLDEVNRLKTKKIFSLRCNEIEMLLLDEFIFKEVLNRLYKQESAFDSFKSAFFDKLRDRKEHLIKRLVKTQVEEKLKYSVIDDKHNKTKDEIKECVRTIFCTLDIDVLWAECDRKLTDIINCKDYEEGLRYCCLEHNEVLVGVGKPFVSDYATIALGVLSDSKELSTQIRSKYFPEIQG